MPPRLPFSASPVLTLFWTGGAVLVALFPNCAPWLVYDRPAILSGEIWRMFTNPWVHFSLRHLVYDLVPLGLAGWMIERRGWPGFGWFCALGPCAISGALLLFAPRMEYCGGLSGLATGAVVFLALWGLSEPAPMRQACAATLSIMAVKTIFELCTGSSVLATFTDRPVVVSVVSHIAGAATALLVYGIEQNKLNHWCLVIWPRRNLT